MSHKIKIIYDNPDRQLGLSGLMRVKDDALTLEASIESCIDALDELIITYNDCTDNSADIIEKKRKEYPDKIKVYPYQYHIYGIRMSREEYEYAKSLPEDSPHLLSSYYNNALSKVNYKYVMKIDADQIYYTERLRYFRKLIQNNKSSWLGIRIGHFMWEKFWLYREQPTNYLRTSIRYWVKVFLYTFFKDCYFRYIFSLLMDNHSYISLSGINMISVDKEWYVTLCSKNANYIMPYNGEGDHLIFEATEDTYYEPWYDWVISLDNNTKFNLIERFVFPSHDICSAGLAWIHLKYMRPERYKERMLSLMQENDVLVKVEEFSSWSVKKMLSEIGDKLISDNKKTYFSFVHDFDRNIIKVIFSKLTKYIVI